MSLQRESNVTTLTMGLAAICDHDERIHTRRALFDRQ